VVRRVHEKASVDAVLAEMPQPADSGLQHLLRGVAQEIGAAEAKSVAAMAACAAMEEDAARLMDEALPTLVRRVRAGVSVGAVLAEVPQPADSGLQRLLGAVAQEIGTAEARGAAAMAACASAAARVQAQTTRLLADLRELEDRHSEDDIFADLLEVDHGISQMGRLADSIAVLSGGRSGRRWTKPIVMESILRGAVGRIEAYRRVRLHSTSNVAVVGYAAAGVMHALAELIDNAATFSNERTAVHVYVEEEDAGVLITIDDGGLGMRKRERRRAETLVSEPMELTMLSGTRLGLPVVGRLADKYNFTVNFRPSSRGGTGVVVMLPHELITQPKQDFRPAAPPPVQTPVRSAAPDASNKTAVPAGGEESGRLPRRRRGATFAAETRGTPRQVARPVQAGRDPGARFAAFRQAAGGSRDPDATSPANEESR
jgi:signal transduction histidine kinase